MEELKKSLKGRNDKEIEALNNLITELKEKMDDSSDNEFTLSSYWQIRKNYEKLKYLCLELARLGLEEYNEYYIKAFKYEIYFYEKLLQKWRIHFPENNIRYDYYIELAKLEYDYFIKNKFLMERNLREEIFLYSFNEANLNLLNQFVIINNLKLAQKRLEIMVINNVILENYDELFIIYEVLGNLYISLYMLLISTNKNIENFEYLLLESYLCFTLSYENRLINDKPQVYRQGIVDMPYIELFYNFFKEEGYSNYYSLEGKIEFLHNKYPKLLKNTIISKKLKKIEKEAKILLERKKDIEFNTELIEKFESKDIYSELRRIEIGKEIAKKCKTLSEKITRYQNKIISSTDFEIYVNQFDDEDVKIEFLSVLDKNLIYISFEQMKEYILKLIEMSVPKSKDKVKIVIFKSGFQESSVAWAYFTKFYTDVYFKFIKAGKLIEDLKELSYYDERYYIFIDDVIGTGNQFIEFFQKELSIKLDEFLKIKENYPEVQFKLLAGVGSWKSKKKISGILPFFHESDILYYKTINEVDKAFNQKHWNAGNLKKLKDFLKNIDIKFWQGYGNSEYLVVLEWNTPNNTIGCLWHDTNEWKALFPRKN